MLKTSIINFGEDLVPRILREAQNATDAADVCLALGSSLTVTPAADIPASLAIRGGNLIIVNMQPTPLDDLASVRIFGKVDEIMRILMAQLDVAVPDAEVGPIRASRVAPRIAAAGPGKMGAGEIQHPVASGKTRPHAISAMRTTGSGAQKGLTSMDSAIASLRSLSAAYTELEATETSTNIA
jgi:hypothetical protein